jgi:hypothetical protein
VRTPENTALESEATARVTVESRERVALDGAGRAKNGRQTHGVNVVKRALRELNASRKTLDRRTGAGKWLHETREQLIDAIGGEAVLTPQLAAVIDSACRTKLLLDHVDAYLLEMGPRIVHRRRRQLIAAVQQRTALADSLLRHWEKLGLERKPRTVPDIRSYLERKQNVGGTSVP